MTLLRGFSLGRVLLTLGIAIYGLRFVLNRDMAIPDFLHNVALILHEAGHAVLMWAPEPVMVLGGSLMQCLVPLLFAAYFWRSQQRFAACITMFWASFNLIDTAVYIADARAQLLPLLGGDNSIHDWNYLLSSAGWLNADQALAAATQGLGILAYVVSVSGGLWFAREEHQRWWWQPEPDPEQIPVQHLRNIGARSAALLERIGVKTRGDLVKIGALEAYRQLLEIGVKPSFSLLYALHGAITDCDWNRLGEKEKAYLRAEAESFEGTHV